MKTITYQKNIAVRGAYDVAVVGSGPAGLCAAVAAAEEESLKISAKIDGIIAQLEQLKKALEGDE